MMTKSRKRKLTWAIGAFGVLAVVLAAAWLLPSSRSARQRSVAWVEARSCYLLTAPGLDTLYCAGLQADTTFLQVALSDSGLASVVRANGCWVQALPLLPSCRGRMLTTSRTVPPDTVSRRWNASPATCLQRQQACLWAYERRLEQALREYRYYLRIHTVQDEGYAWAADEYERLQLRHIRLSRAMRLLDTLQRSGRARLERRLRLMAYIVTDSGRVARRPVGCHLLRVDHRRGWAVWQTDNRRLPNGASSLCTASLMPLLHASEAQSRRAQVEAINRPAALPLQGNGRPERIEGRLWREGRVWRHNVPLLSGANGAPVLDERGRVAGLIDGDRLVRPAGWWTLFADNQ